MIGIIIPVPKNVSDTGYIKIVGDQRHCHSRMRDADWELLAAEYNSVTDKTSTTAFRVTEEEVLQWKEKTE